MAALIKRKIESLKNNRNKVSPSSFKSFKHESNKKSLIFKVRNKLEKLVSNKHLLFVTFGVISLLAIILLLVLGIG
jgi:hypothetical protein